MATITGNNSSNLLIGTNSSDTINAGGGSDIVFGGNGNDTIDGGTGNDLISGGSGSDVIDGGSGNDFIDGGSGNDTIDGGTGNDLISGGTGNDTISGGSGNDLISGDSGSDTLDGGAGNDALLGGSGNDTLIHRSVENALSYDIYDGGSGRDTLRLIVSAAIYNSAGFQADIAQLQQKLALGSATDYLESINLLVTSIERLEVIVEGNSNQAPSVALANTIASLPENTATPVKVADIVVSDDSFGINNLSLSDPDAGSFEIVGTELYVKAGVALDYETLSSLQVTVQVDDPGVGATPDGSADFTLTVTNVSGHVVGDADANILVGTTEEDTVQGLAGNDTLQGLAGNDILDGGEGFDRAIYTDAAGPITVDLAAGTASGVGVGADTLLGIEGIRGSDFADTFVSVGYAGASVPPGTRTTLNEFEGMGGDDVISGNGTTRISYLNATGAVAVDILAGTATGDLSVGSDTFTGVSTVRGSNFDDTISGSIQSSGFENFNGRGGNDFIDGRGGNDRAQYNFDPTTSGIRVNMNGIVMGDAVIGTDTLRSIEAIRGTVAADVYVATSFGTTGANIGSNGTLNEFEGDGGDDFITGNGNTRISYLHALDGVTVDIAAGIAQGTAAGDLAGVGVDRFSSVNAVRGSTFADSLSGSNANELFEGSGGDDLIDGGGGFDIARYDSTVDDFAGPLGIAVNMAAGTVTGRDAAATAVFGSDTLVGIEGIRGSDVNDLYDATGFVGFNEIQGMDGDDQITGNGQTRISYANALARVTVDLSAGTAAGFDAGDAAGVGTDTIVSGVNAVRGSGFNDVFRGSGNNETFDGQGDNDRMLYDNATGGIAVTSTSAATMSVTGAGVGTDTLQAVEFVTGSAHDDSFNVATFGGFNEFQGGGGNDIITGNNNTRVSYLDASAGVTVNLTAPGAGTAMATSDDAGIGTDTFTGVNRIRGSSVLNGSDNTANEFFEGRGGDDLIDGRGGLDFAIYDVALGTGSGINVAVSLASTQIWTVTGDATVGTDTLTAIESFRGTDFADTFNAAGFNGASTDAVAATFNEFEGNGGNDIVTGNGNTRITFVNATGGVTVDLAAGTATGDASVGSDTITGGVNRVRGSTFDDTIGGTGGNDTLLDGREGVDTVSYLAAVAGVTVNLATNSATGGGGNDTLANFESLIGSNFGDALIGNAGVNVITGAGGDDAIDGGGDRDIAVFSGDFADYTATPGAPGSATVADSVAGRDGTDTLINVEMLEFADRYVLNVQSLSLPGLNMGAGKALHGTVADEAVTIGTNGNLRLTDLGGGTDTVTLSGAGTYLFNFQNVEILNGSGGNENVYLQNVASGVSINLLGGIDALTLANGANDVTIGGIENVIGGTGDDQITVAGASSMTSTITGGLGADVLTGSGDNIETYRYTSVTESSGGSIDTINNFTEAQDLLDSAIDANTATGGDDAFLFAGQNGSVVANSVTWFQDGINNVTIVQADTNGDMTADLTITLTGLKNLSATDFLL